MRASVHLPLRLVHLRAPRHRAPVPLPEKELRAPLNPRNALREKGFWRPTAPQGGAPRNHPASMLVVPYRYWLRVDGPGLLHHVTARVNWRAWHLDDDRAKELLAQLIQEAAHMFGIEVYGAVLMSNHLHLSVRSPPEALYRHHTSRRTSNRHYRPWPRGHQKSTVLAQFMRFIRQRMSVRRQKELGLSGRFWEGRYDARPIEDRTSLIVRIAYDHRNPVVAGMVRRPEQYRWSTARTWQSGEVTPFPLRIHQPVPFGLTFDELRDAVLRHQNDERLDTMREQLDVLWSCPGAVPDEAWSRLFRDRGAHP